MAKKTGTPQPAPHSVLHLNHNTHPVPISGVSLLQGTINYLRENADHYSLSAADLGSMSAQLEGKITEEKPSFRLETHKEVMNTLTYVFVQTCFGLPVWQAAISVCIDTSGKRVLSSLSTAHSGINATLPSRRSLAKPVTVDALAGALGIAGNSKTAKKELKIQSERLLIYQYESGKRTIAPINEEISRKEGRQPGNEFVLPLQPVPAAISDGHFYVVREVIFMYPLPGVPKLFWRCFVDVETGAVLYLRAFGSNVTGMVFEKDPITKGSGFTPTASDANLSSIRDSVTLTNLNAPSGGTQALAGTLVSVLAVEGPAIAAPTQPGGSPDFSYNARTNNFAAVNTYYHCNNFLQLILDMGFGMGYFNGTAFPVPCDHRGLSQPNTGETLPGFGNASHVGSAINAHCLGNTTGITSVDFALGDVSDLILPVTNPQITADHLGIASDVRVALHEIGGHGVLYCHVGSANFGFSHSAGDSIAVILNDPGTQAPDRFDSFPFTFQTFPAAAKRRHDRTPAAGWGWEGNIALNPFGASDGGGYNNEQILSTTLFRLYRSMGGDAADINMQTFASRFATYLILKAISTLTTSTNPPNAQAFELAMENGDASNWNSLNPMETQAGGAYVKVIRWAFEKQGLFQLPGTPTPNNNAGNPPAVDVYIDDGRHGEYDYQPNHWSCPDIWNRTDLTMGDGGGAHQDPIVDQPNYAFVRIKNRGYQAATNIVVKGFHCFPGVGLEYPTDWMAMTTPQLSAPDLAANDSTGEVAGPFEWTPSQIGHECLFFTASAQNDPCNIDSRVTGPIPEWRLVPHDNNIGQRNVAPVAGSGLGLIASFENRPFWIRNSFSRQVPVSIHISLPEALRKNNWRLVVTSEGGTSFFLKEGERKQVTLKMIAGSDFNIRETAVHEPIDIVVKQDGIVVGGMQYYIDPNMEYPNTPGAKNNCTDRASSLLRCIDLSHVKIKSVNIREISLDICMDDDCDCNKS